MNQAAAPNTGQKDDLRPGAKVTLGMLLLVYIFNFLDRQILSILSGPIQEEMGLTDSELGLLGGFAFALLYSTLAVPLSFLADRTNRSWVITIALAFWSFFTALCGAAQNFWQLFAARVGVGIGEAGGVAPSYALISEYFPSNRRASALAIYSMGVPIGLALGVLIGGYIAANIDWRVAFFVVGGLGVLIAPIFKFFVRDLPKPAAAQAQPHVSFGDTLRLLLPKKSFWFLSFGAAFSSMLGYGFAFWTPLLMQRSFGLNLWETSQVFAALVFFGGVTGLILGGRIADKMGPSNKAAYGLVPASAFMIGVPFYALGLMQDSVAIAALLFLIPNATQLVWLGPVTNAIQHLVGQNSRATASALFLLVNNLLGLGGGIYFLGSVSDYLQPIYGEESLRYTMLWSLSLLVIASVLMFFASFFIKSEWVEEGQSA